MMQFGHAQQSASGLSDGCAICFVLPLFGGILGGLGCIVAMGLMTAQLQWAGPAPRLDAILLTLLICIAQCSAIGLGVALSLVRWHRTSFFLLLLVTLISWFVVRNWWDERIRMLGRDAFEMLLFYPPASCSFLALVTGLVSGLLSLARSLGKTTEAK